MYEEPEQLTSDITNKWSVVNFMESNEITLVPNNWITRDRGNEKYFCLWPVGDKNITKKIKKSWLPESSWQSFEIRILKEFASYEEGKMSEKRLENESTDHESEQNFGRGHRKVKHKVDLSYVEEIPAPPKLRRVCEESEENNNLVEILEANGCEDAQESPVYTTNYIVSDGQLVEDRNYVVDNINTSDHATSTITMSSSSGLSTFASKEPQTESFTTQAYGVMIEVREIVKEIKECLQNYRNPSATNNITNFENTPKEPFNKHRKLMRYEQELETNEDHRNQLETMLYLLGGSTPKDVIKRGLKRLFTNKLATRCSWVGRNHNYPLQHLMCIRLLKTAVRKRFSNMTDVEFEDNVKLWFRQAGLRYTREIKQ